MFTYNELSNDNNTATISLDGLYEHDIYVEAPAECEEDFSNFNI
ncbi:hypothetical protein [Limosilactobacillus vaginalis]|nr:hypothetical protein [Limosilactobacillus vaginalis]